MKKIVLLLNILALASFVQAQTCSLKSTATEAFTLTMKATGGTNGASICWNPDMKKYYAGIAGNADFPIETFSVDGRSLGYHASGFDLRGLWYNPSTQQVECNGYSDYGWYSFLLSSDGVLSSAGRLLKSGMNQPTDQSVGAYDSKSKKVFFLNDDLKVVAWSRSSIKKGKMITLKNIPHYGSNLNYSLMFTGCSGKEFCLLNFDLKELYFFNMKGAYTGTVSLPSGVSPKENFNCGFANNYFFLFNTDSRVWTAYSVCQ